MTARLRRLLSLADAPRPRVALAVGLGAATVLCGVGLMATAGHLISRAAEQPPILSLTVAIVGVRFFGLARPLARYAERLASHDLALRVLGRVRVRVYERVEPLAPAELSGDRGGDLLSRLVGDVDALQNLHLRLVGPPLVALAAGVVSVAVTAAFLPAAALVLAAGLLVGGIAVPGLVGAAARRAGQRQASLRGALSAELVELLAAAPELAVYGREEERLARVRAADGALVRGGRRDAFAAGLGDGLGLLVAGGTVAGVLAVSVSAHAAGRLEGVLVAMLALLALASFEAVQPLAEAARSLAATLAAGRRVLELVDRRPAICDPDRPAPPPGWPFALALEDVAVRYPGAEHRALEQVSLRLEPGRRVALVGPSGAGKSTVVNALLRFVDPEQGRVTLAGRDLREYRQHDVRAAIAVAGQDSHLFSASIRANLSRARPGATDAELERALDRARLLDWVHTLPDGLDTLVGEEGRELSGGQRQRLTVARALLSDAPVLVLDEPTSHLDGPTAEELVRDVLAAAADRAVLFVTHRPEGLDLVDEVVTLDAGRVTGAAA
ncbi:MAG: thiol reductant ABC exporter subunit CydC [Gaiellaceae bacterium]